MSTTGNRQAVKAEALVACPSCGTQRGNRRKGWAPMILGGQVKGYTCPDCPTHDEPIRREPSGRFLAVVGTKGTDGKRVQYKRRFNTLSEARAWVEEVRLGAAGAGRSGRTYVDPSRMTVSTICQHWLARREAEVGKPGGIRPVTLAGYRSALFSLLAQVGDRVAREATADDIEGALRALATDGGRGGRALSHRTLTYALGALRQAFAYGQRQGWLTVNVAQLARAPRKHEQDGGARRAQRWAVGQLVTFRSHVDVGYSDGAAHAAEPWIVAGMRLTLCGMRRSEVLAVDWQAVDLDAGTVEVRASRTKTGTGTATAIGPVKVANSRRVVEVEQIHPGTVRALRALWLAQGRPAEGLVVRDSVGQPVHPDTYSRRFKTLCTEAEVAYPGSVHNVRHTLATALSEGGLSDVAGAALLGHDVATFRRFYLVTDTDAAAEAARAAGRLFASGT